MFSVGNCKICGKPTSYASVKDGKFICIACINTKKTRRDEKWK